LKEAAQIPTPDIPHPLDAWVSDAPKYSNGKTSATIVPPFSSGTRFPNASEHLLAGQKKDFAPVNYRRQF
jgi:hypothetical protein